MQIKKKENDPQSFISILNDLKSVYNDYIDQYIIALDELKSILNKITGKLRKYINDDDRLFSFIDGKFIGKNLKVMLKYVKIALGKNLRNLGFFLIIIGCSLAISISSTILLLVIIENIDKDIKPIGNHLTQTSSSSLKQLKNQSQLSAKPINEKPINKSIEEATQFLIEGCNIPSDILDERGNCLSGWRIGSKNGPKEYVKDYIPPIGWTGIGLKVAFLYDNGNNDWLGNDNCNGEWYIGYHGVKSIEAIQGICKEGFRRGPGQAHKNSDNKNPLNNKIYPKCGEGVYFTNEIKEATGYTEPISYNGNKYRIVFMCRINPYSVRIADIGNNREYWVVDGDKLGDLHGHKRSDEVRPYRILMFKM